jgi:hypothetical protein
VAEAMVKMFAELLEATVDQALEQMALAIAHTASRLVPADGYLR